jgi:RNA polymerase sigma factor (sigma-70 family)
VASKVLDNVMNRLRSLAALHQVGQLPDRELLERFIQQRDETAFTALVERHAPLVLKVCRRVLHHQQDAEDSCQATFLVLVRRASSIRKLDSLGSWLHGVAVRLSLKRRTQIIQSRRAVEALKKNEVQSQPRFTCAELSSALDEELQCLPEKYRAPLILCYLQAKTRDEAARELALEQSTLKGRLEWGRKLLRRRLTRRGIALSAALLIATLGQPASAAAPASLVIAIVKSSVAVAAGNTLAVGLVSTRVANLVQGFLHAALVKQIQVGAAVVLMTICMAGAGWFTFRGQGREPKDANEAQFARLEFPDDAVKPATLPPAVVAFLPMAKQEPGRENEKEPPREKRESKTKEPSLIERGEQLALRCANCHTPRNAKGDLDLTRHLQGAHVRSSPNKRERVSEDEAPDITAGGRAGKWSAEKMSAFLSKSAKAGAPVSAHRLQMEDAQAVTAYLRTLPGKKKGDGRRGE